MTNDVVVDLDSWFYLKREPRVDSKDALFGAQYGSLSIQKHLLVCVSNKDWCHEEELEGKGHHYFFGRIRYFRVFDGWEPSLSYARTDVCCPTPWIFTVVLLVITLFWRETYLVASSPFITFVKKHEHPTSKQATIHTTDRSINGCEIIHETLIFTLKKRPKSIDSSHWFVGVLFLFPPNPHILKLPIPY